MYIHCSRSDASPMTVDRTAGPSVLDLLDGIPDLLASGGRMFELLIGDSGAVVTQVPSPVAIDLWSGWADARGRGHQEA